MSGEAYRAVQRYIKKESKKKPKALPKQKSNFKCNACGHKFYVAEYTQSYGKQPNKEFKDKNGVPFKCERSVLRECSTAGFTFIAKKKGVPELLGASNGTFPSEKELVTRKQEFAKLRSRHHFKNEVLPTHRDRHLKRHFEKKYKGTKFVDHEKMKL